MRNQSLAIAVFAGLLSVQGLAAGAEAPAPVPAPGRAAPAPVRSAPAPAAPANNQRPAQAPARPAQNGANANNSGTNNSGARGTPARTNEQGRAPGSTLPPANAQEAQNRLRANEPRTAQNGQGRNDERRWGRGRGQGQSVYYGGYMPYSWWYKGDSYWSQPYESYPDNNQQADNGSSTPAAPAQNVPTPGRAPTPAQDQAKATNQLEGSPSYRQAVAQLAKVQAAYDAASAKALEKLKKNPEYQALIQHRDHAQDKVEAVQASAKIPSPEQVTPIAQKKLDLNSKITRMEQDAIQSDPDAAAAKSKVVDLNAQVQTLKKQPQNAGQ